MDELTNLLCNHQYTKEEIEESKKIVNIVKTEGFSELSSSFPLIKSETGDYYYGFGDSSPEYLYLIALKLNNGTFNYYIIEGRDRGTYSIQNFQNIIASYQKEWGTQIDSRNCLLYYFMDALLDDDQRDNCESTSYVLYNGWCLKAVLDGDSGRYMLEPLVKSGWLYGNSGEFDIDKFMHQIAYSKPVFTKIECPSCRHTWMFNDSIIPDGERYELPCQQCGMLVKRKKV